MNREYGVCWHGVNADQPSMFMDTHFDRETTPSNGNKVDSIKEKELFGK